MRHPWSIARRIAAVHMLLVAVIAVFSVWVAYLQAREVALSVESRHVLGVASVLAADPAVRDGLAAGAVGASGAGATGTGTPDDGGAAALQWRLGAWAGQGRLSWMSVMDPAGVRVATTFPEQRGEPFPESLDRALAGDAWTELSLPGVAGPSVRAIVPVKDPATGEVLGALAAGVQVSDLEIMATAQLPRLVLAFAAVGLGGILVAGFVARYLDRVTLGRGPEEIAEQFLLAEAAMDSVEAGIVVLSPDGRVRLANAAAARVLDGVEAGTAPSATAPRVPEALAAALAEHPSGEFTTALGDRVVVVQQRRIPPHGRGAVRRPGAGPETVPAEVLAAAALEGVAPAPAGTRVLTLHDRTDLQRLGDDLTVAHTLGSALRAQTHEHANQLHAALSLVESGRLDAAKEVLARHRRPTGAGDDVVPALLDAKAAQARERGVAFTQAVELASPSPLGPLDLLTVVGNLVDNAVDAAAEPGVPEHERWVDVEVVSDEEGLVVQVADGGPGPDALDRIFDQGFSTKPAGAAGRGLGLWLVRRLAEGAGGSVEVAADSGTVFRVEVPRG